MGDTPVPASKASGAPEPASPIDAPASARARRGRPRSDLVHRRILDATRTLLAESGFSRLRLEHVAARAGVGKATIYRRWGSKEALCEELLADLAAPHIAVPDVGDTRAEMLACVVNPLEAITQTEFGPVIRALMSQIAGNPSLGDPFRATVVATRREEIARVVERGIARGDLRPDADPEVATELLAGPVYYRLVFGGELTPEFAERIVDAVLLGYAAPARTVNAGATGRPFASGPRGIVAASCGPIGRL